MEGITHDSGRRFVLWFINAYYELMTGLHRVLEIIGEWFSSICGRIVRGSDVFGYRRRQNADKHLKLHPKLAFNLKCEISSMVNILPGLKYN